MHCVSIKLLLHPPCALVIDCKRRAAIMNPVEIMPGTRGKTRIECIRRLLDIQDADALIRHDQMRIDCIAHLARAPILGKIDMGNLRCRMNAASVRPAALNVRSSPQNFLNACSIAP